MAQVVEYLPCKSKALSSYSSTAKKKNQNKIWNYLVFVILERYNYGY
jgi:hypothetical protein